MAKRAGLLHWRLIVMGLVTVALLAGAAVVLAQPGPPGGTPGRGPGQAVDGYVIELVVEGRTIGQFHSVSGLAIETEVIEFRDGSTGEVRKIPGDTTYGDITLERTVGPVDELWEWLQNVIDGVADRRNGSIVIFDHAGTEVKRYNLINAWPSKWEGPTVTPSTQVLTEKVTLTVEAIEPE